MICTYSADDLRPLMFSVNRVQKRTRNAKKNLSQGTVGRGSRSVNQIISDYVSPFVGEKIVIHSND